MKNSCVFFPSYLSDELHRMKILHWVVINIVQKSALHGNRVSFPMPLFFFFHYDGRFIIPKISVNGIANSFQTSDSDNNSTITVSSRDLLKCYTNRVQSMVSCSLRSQQILGGCLK